MSAFEELVERADVVSRNGSRVEARCPAHDDRTPSLSIGVRDDGEGAVIHCHAGCEPDAILGKWWLPSAALFDSYWEAGANGNGRLREVTAYPYLDEAGTLLFEVVRFEPKDFRPRRPDGHGGWVWNLHGTRRVLFRLPAVRAAVAEGRAVYVAEGEEDVLALERAGVVATCNPGGAGAGKWLSDYSQALRDAEVAVIADRDDAGREHARQVAASLRAVAARVRVLEPVEGNDARDHLNAGHGVDEFAEVQQSTDEAMVCSRLDAAVVNLVDRIRDGIPEREWLPASGGLLAAGKRHLCAAPAKTGKSLAWLVHAVNVVLAGGSVAILDRENGADEYATRLSDVVEARKLTAAQQELVRERLLYLQWPVVRMTDPDRDAYVAWLKARAGLVIFDSSRKFLDHLGLQESSSDDYGRFMDSLVDPLFAAGIATLILDNTGHEETGRARGTSSKADLQEVVLTLEKAEPFDYFTTGLLALSVTHTRLGDSGERWTMKLGGQTYGAFAPVRGSAPLPENAQRLLDALTAEPQSERTLGERAELPKTTARRWLLKLAQLGLARQAREGWSTSLPGADHEWTTSNDGAEPKTGGWSAGPGTRGRTSGPPGSDASQLDLGP